MARTGTSGQFGLRIYAWSGATWVTWYKTMKQRDAQYTKMKKKVGLQKTRKTPYRIVKKVSP